MKLGTLVYMLLLLMNGTQKCPDPEDHDYEYHLQGIRIEGATNINNFEFMYESPLPVSFATEHTDCYSKPDTCLMDFSIPVQSFRSSIPAMRNDFLALLKASEYPEIVVAVQKSSFDCIAGGTFIDQLDMIITLAGTKKALHADYSILTGPENRITVSGETKFLLTDFQLEPPEKAMGLVRVLNEVFIKFDIVISTAGIDSNQALH
ncbi:MAG: YceI family protein [Bacteroidales bacterium]|nr:YceI family protein [Bacteroidales bacterium]